MPGKKKNVQEDGFAAVNGVKLHYVTQGKGPLAILLHGFPEFWYSWRHQIPALAEQFQVVVPDLRGYNSSDKPPSVQAYYMDELMRDVRELIKYFGQEKAVIIAHDWGGVIAWNLAAFYPEVVDKLVVMNAPHPLAYVREMKNNRRQIFSSWYIYLFQLPQVPEWYMRRNNFRQLELVFRGWAVRKDAFSDADIARFKEAMGKTGALTAAINYYRGLFRDPKGLTRLKNFPLIAMPTLLIWGMNDRALTNELTYNLAPYFALKPEIRYIPRCSHWVQQEQPDLVNEYLREFLFAQKGSDRKQPIRIGAHRRGK